MDLVLEQFGELAWVRGGGTFDLIAFDGLDCDVGAVYLAVPAEDVAELTRADLALKHVDVHCLRHITIRF